jgi:hypothetical protein
MSLYGLDQPLLGLVVEIARSPNYVSPLTNGKLHFCPVTFVRPPEVWYGADTLCIKLRARLPAHTKDASRSRRRDQVNACTRPFEREVNEPGIINTRSVRDPRRQSLGITAIVCGACYSEAFASLLLSGQVDWWTAN